MQFLIFSLICIIIILIIIQVTISYRLTNIEFEFETYKTQTNKVLDLFLKHSTEQDKDIDKLLKSNNKINVS